MERNREDNLNESWVEVDGRSSATRSPVQLRNSAMEKLLLEAQKESSNTSHADSPVSSKASSNEDRGGVNGGSQQADVDSLPELKERDWVWDWSSRPEIIPPSDSTSGLKTSTSQRRCKTSIRNTWIIRGLLFSMENLPMLLLTHACSFLLGATTMFIYLKRYGNNCTSAVVSRISFVGDL